MYIVVKIIVTSFLNNIMCHVLKHIDTKYEDNLPYDKRYAKFVS